MAFVLSVNSNAWPFTWKSLESTSAFPGLARRYGGLAYVRGQLCVFGGEGQNGTALSKTLVILLCNPQRDTTLGFRR